MAPRRPTGHLEEPAASHPPPNPLLQALFRLEAYFEAEHGSRGYTLDGSWMTFARTWAEPVVDIGYQATDAEDDGLAAVAWRGTWHFVPTDTAE